ncbi:hypothetical protein AAFF_G00378580 [Aldrovandia affinis]|uniref:non-specific serine/threonine protein kinase n=1 Tax=Aldrovandia affinis TaxID=143900 RepID=A0AAD7SHH0_9TELE|nr:hypothetical protein AAFF_G00378580 [Aldrovandia affinis]
MTSVNHEKLREAIHLVGCASGLRSLHKSVNRKSWIEKTFCKRDCVKFIPISRDIHRCSPICQVCQNLIRCCCGRLIGEHAALSCASPLRPMAQSSGGEEAWSVDLHTRASPTDAFGTIDFQDGPRSCRAKYLRLSCDSRADQVLELMLREWQMDLPKLVLSVHGGKDNFHLPPKVRETFSKGLIRAAESTGAWILTEGINTGVSRYVGDAVKLHGTHDVRKRYSVGIAPLGVIENQNDLMGKDVIRPYQTVGNPMSKRECLNGLHSHFLLVDDGTAGKQRGQIELRRRLETLLQLQKIHPKLAQRVPVLCVLVEGGPGLVPLVLEYVRSDPPVPVIVFEGTGRAADLLAFIHKQTSDNRQLDTYIREDVMVRIQYTFGLGKAQSRHLYGLLIDCMDYRDSISIFDSMSVEQQDSDSAILTALLKGTRAPAPDQLSITLAWDRVDIAKKHILVYGQHWKVGSLEQAMLDALVMDRVGFVKLLIENGMNMNCFLTVSRLEELYNTVTNIPKMLLPYPDRTRRSPHTMKMKISTSSQQFGPANNLLHHLVEDVKQIHLPVGYKVSLIDVGLVIEYLIGGAYRSSYTRKHFRATYNRLQGQRKEGSRENVGRFNGQSKVPSMKLDNEAGDPPTPHFFRTAQPYKRKEKNVFTPKSRVNKEAELNAPPLFVHNFNDLFVWAVLMRRQQMALFLWQHGEEAMARGVVACKLYRTMAHEAKQSNMADSTAEELKTYSIEFGQLAVDLLDNAFRQNERMAMKLLTYEMKDWSNFTCLQMAVSSGLSPFVSHSCTQMLLTDLWMGRLNMRKNSCFKIILSILVPPAIFLLEFKSEAEMSHVPQPQEAQFTWETSGGPGAGDPGRVGMSQCDTEKGCENSKLDLDAESHGILWTRKVYEFYNASVVKFWFHSMAYLAFLMLYSYTVLVKMRPKPSPQEWLVIVYILSTTVEKVREVLISEPQKLSKKLKVWLSEYWNMADSVAILLFLVGLGLRWQDAFRTAGRIVYCLDIIFWYVRLLDLFAINQHVGPYLTMIAKMTANMFYIVVMMAIVLLSFGVSRKAILSPDEPPSWTLAKDVVFQPYWMIFGEVYAAEIDACAQNAACAPGSFITQLLQAVYLFFQYIIMVNILIAFFNNVHMTLCLSFIHRHQSRKSEQEAESGLKLYLCQEDLKKLHDFEEECVAMYFHRKSESLHCSQESRIKSTNEAVEEMSMQLQEVVEEVHSVTAALQALDGQLGRLQDMSALVVDTLAVVSASDRCQTGGGLLQHRPLSSNRRLPHSWSHLGHMTLASPPAQHHSTPPSLLRCIAHCRPLLDHHLCDSQDWGSRQWRGVDPGGEEPPLATPPSSFRHAHATILCFGGGDRATPQGGHPLCASDPAEHFNTRPMIHDLPLSLSQKESTEEEDGEEEEEKDAKEEGDNEDSPDWDTSLASSCAFLQPDSQGGAIRGVVNPAFSRDGEPTDARLALSNKRHRGLRGARLRRCQSLSASLECMGCNPNTLCSSIPSLNVPPKTLGSSIPTLSAPQERGSLTGGRSHSLLARGGDTLLDSAQHRELSKSTEIYLSKRPESKMKACSRKTVKIQESDRSICTKVNLHCSQGTPDPFRKWQLQGEDGAARSSASLTQLNFVQMDLMQKCGISCQESLGSVPSVWSSWAKSQSRRSSVQSVIGLDTKSSPFQTAEHLDPHYSAVERNNLMRLAHTIPFTPISLLAGEEPLSQDRMDGDLCRAMPVVCTWAEGGILEPGSVYIVKAFQPEVVNTWQRIFPSNTLLNLCLRRIQQQQAAQKLMHIFNQIKPDTVPYSPRFLDMFLVHWRSQDQWLTIERNLDGDFRKYNDNMGTETSPRSTLDETVLAFSHWTYQYSRGELLVIDLQGVGLDLTDPSVIRLDDNSSPGDVAFGPANLGDHATQTFILKHTCNTCCAKLCLSDLRRSNVSSGKINPAFEEDSAVIMTRL